MTYLSKVTGLNIDPAHVDITDSKSIDDIVQLSLGAALVPIFGDCHACGK